MRIATNDTSSSKGSKHGNEKAERLADIVQVLLEECRYVPITISVVVDEILSFRLEKIPPQLLSTK